MAALTATRVNNWPFRVEVGNDASGLQWDGGLPNEIEIGVGRDGRNPQCARGVAVMMFKCRRDVAGPFGVERRRVPGARIAQW